MPWRTSSCFSFSIKETNPLFLIMNNEIGSKISQHYSQGELLNKMEAALKKSGRDLNSLTFDDLLTFEEIHVGGKAATLSLASRANLGREDHLLDVGCGLGGPARTLAVEFGCQVTGIDISEEFCQVASVITEKINLAKKVQFKCADALDIPFPDATFDVIWSQHCSMNIPDKAGLFSEFRRVLKNDGQLVTHDIVSGSVQPIHYPVPWARDEDISFLVSADELKNYMIDAGFKMQHWENITSDSMEWFNQQRKLAKTSGKSPLHQFLIFGDDLRQMGPNILKNMQENRAAVMEGIWS